MVTFEEAKYLQPVIKIPGIGLNNSELDPARKRGYDFHDFKKDPKDKDAIILTLLGDYPVIGEKALEAEVAFLKANLRGLIRINIVSKRSTCNV